MSLAASAGDKAALAAFLFVGAPFARTRNTARRGLTHCFARYA